MGPAGRLVTIKRSGGDGAHFPLSLSTCLFGRGVECDIRIQLPVVSRQHCKIEVHEQKAVLFNFSSANPTQVNGSVIDGPVQLKHGDVITVIDRSFRYEDDRHQSGSTSAESPGRRHGQAPRRVSRSSSSSDPDGEVEGHGAARSPLTEEGVSEESLAHTEGVRAARAVPHSSSRVPAARSPANGRRSDFLGDDRGNTAGPLAGSPGQGSRGTLVSRNAGPESVPSPWCLERGGEKDSPFRKLYESMKEKLDVKSEKENVLQNRRKSGSRSHCAGDSESVGGTWGETPLQGSPKSRRKSWLGSQTKAVPALGQREEERTGEGPGPTLEASASPSVPPMDTMRGSTPGRGSQRNSLRKRRSGGGSGVHGAEPVNPEQTALCTPKEPFPEHGTPTGGESAHSFGDTPEKIFSRKRRSSLPPKVDIPATETEITKPAVLTPLLVHVERKVPGSSLGPPQLMGAAAASPGLSPTDVSNWDESIHEMEGVPLKTRRVSFGGHLRPELFDENLPPNTPLKRGETPMKRRSLVTHAPAVLKKIIKGQPQESGKEGSSEVRLEATTQNMFVSSPACHPTKSSSVANDGRRRSSKAPASSGSQSPPQTEVPKRSGRRSSGAPSRGAPSGRGQQGLLQVIQSRRRSGASEANLIVAKSWADIVKLSAKQTQAKAVKHGPPRRPSKRQRRANTPKKPTGRVYEFSTGHANSPCTIVVGKAHVQKVAAPARPYRMPNNFVFNKKIDFSEDLSGLTEMFKTPAKEKPKKMSLRLTAFSNSEGVFGKQFQVPEAEEKPQLCTPAKFGESVFPSAENAPEEPSDKKSASPALRKERMPVNENMLTPPSETEPSRAASRVKKSRRSVGLRNTQESGTECEKEDPEFATIESILGRCLRTSPAQEQLLEGEMEGSERAFATCKRNFESKENSEKRVVMRRSRTPSELKCAQRTDVITTKRLQETESKEGLVGIHCFLQTPGCAEAPVGMENKATMRCCRSPKPEPVGTLSKMNVWIKTPSQRVSAEAPSMLRKLIQTPGDTKHTHKEAVGGDESMKSNKFSDQQQDLAEHVARSRRRSRTLKKKAQSVEDLTGFKELFQTPNHIVEPVTDDKIMKIPSKSPKPEPISTPTSTKRRLRTPLGKVDVEEELSALRESTPTPGETTHSPGDPEGDAEDIMALKGTPEQKLDSAEHVTGSRRRSRTPKRKVEPTEDLTGFKELFQTPHHTDEPMTDDKTMKIPSKSPKPEPVSTPTSTKRHLRTPLGKVDVEEELSALRESTPTAGETTHSPGDLEGDTEDTRALKGTREQKRDSAEHATGSRRRSRTPKRKVEPTEDLTGFKELFQTPNHIVEPKTDNKTMKIPSKSPKPEPVSRPSSTKRHLRTPLGKVDVEEELSALRESTPTPGKTTHSPGDPEGDSEDIRALKGTPEQKRDSAEHVSGIRGKSRTATRVNQPIEDLTGFKELFQTPRYTVESMSEDKATKMPCNSAQAKPAVMPTDRNRQLKAPPGKAVMKGELSVLRGSTRTLKKITRSHREPEGADKDMKLFKEPSEQKLLPAENVTASKRRLRTRKEKAQFPADPASLKELLQVPNHTEDPVAVAHSTEMPSGSPQAEVVIMPARTRRQLKAPPGAVAVQGEPSALRRPRGTSGRATRFHGEPVDGAKDIQVCKGPPKREPGPVGNTVGSERLLRSRKAKAQPLHSPANSKQLLQSPAEDKELGTDTAGVMRTSTQTPDQSKPVTTSRRALRALNMKPTEELVDSRGPVKSQSESSAALSPKRKREDGSCMGPGRLRPRTRAQDTAEEEPQRKRQRTAPREQRAPPELKKRQRVLREDIEPVDNLPSANRKTKNKGRKEDVTSPNKEVSLCSSLPSKTKAAGQKPELLISAGKVQRKQDEKKPVKSSQEVEIQNLEGGAQNSAPGVKVHKRRMSPRPGRRGKVPVPGGAEEKALASSVETHRKAREEKEGALCSGFICLRSRKVTVPPTGDTSESPSKQRVTRSAKRPVQDADKENENKCVKKTRTRSHRGQ
ncbi:proliferation marker protein Ki-67 isoform X2 [Sturnira hondurensis]|uniref:proliferation marker protein Ki-67 isoform X2 n=1 Tax=Sturnira hondurensis TaxID=192404 RepID=UPI00187A1831|nr:proliferation marker protein Ki-67 isoform X2 [Sturnira hondurensis]